MDSGPGVAALALSMLNRVSTPQGPGPQQTRPTVGSASEEQTTCPALVIASYLWKGGVGKTTTSVELGGYFASVGTPTLIVDADPQGSATDFFLDNLNEEERERAKQLAKERHEHHQEQMRGAGRQLLDLVISIASSLCLSVLHGRLSILSGRAASGRPLRQAGGCRRGCTS